jgi:hypothetical protein
LGVRISPSIVSPVCRLKRRIWEVGGVGRAQEAEAVGQHFQRAAAVDAFPLLGLVLEQREDQLLLAQAVGAVDLVLDGHLEELADVEILQIG